MWSNNSQSSSSPLVMLIAVVGVAFGILAGVLAGHNPLILAVGLVAVFATICFLANFEQAVLIMLILRSALDILSAQQVPAAFAIGLDALTLLYVTLSLLTGQRVRTNSFWWLFAGWVMLQGLWVILLPLGGLGLDSSMLMESVREWIRIFSWLMVYLLAMQLKDRLTPTQVISVLFLGLIAPLSVAALQVILPESLLPAIFSAKAVTHTAGETITRVKGTLGHPNTFASFVILFIGLTCWKLKQTERSLRLPWILLLGLLAFFLVSTKAIVGLMMLVVFLFTFLLPRLNLVNLTGGLLLLTLIIGLFVLTGVGGERLNSITDTPLLNPDLGISQAIILSEGDYNSFNWRLSQWHLMLKAWSFHPLMGYGLGLSMPASGSTLLPHNDYIRALVEGGVVGLLTFVGFLGAQAIRLLQLVRQSPRGSGQQDLCLVLLAILAATCVGMITENIWTHTTFFFYWWTLFAIANWDWDEKKLSRK